MLLIGTQSAYHVSDTFQQVQQLSTCDQSCFIFTPPHCLPIPRLRRKQFEGNPRCHISCVNVLAFTTPAASSCPSILRSTLWLLLAHCFVFSWLSPTACPLSPLSAFFLLPIAVYFSNSESLKRGSSRFS